MTTIAAAHPAIRAAWTWVWRILLALALMSLATFVLYHMTSPLGHPAGFYPGDN